MKCTQLKIFIRDDDMYIGVNISIFFAQMTKIVKILSQTTVLYKHFLFPEKIGKSAKNCDD
jgi:hypothetical protein